MYFFTPKYKCFLMSQMKSKLVARVWIFIQSLWSQQCSSKKYHVYDSALISWCHTTAKFPDNLKKPQQILCRFDLKHFTPLRRNTHTRTLTHTLQFIACEKGKKNIWSRCEINLLLFFYYAFQTRKVAQSALNPPPHKKSISVPYKDRQCSKDTLFEQAKEVEGSGGWRRQVWGCVMAAIKDWFHLGWVDKVVWQVSLDMLEWNAENGRLSRVTLRHLSRRSVVKKLHLRDNIRNNLTGENYCISSHC